MEILNDLECYPELKRYVLLNNFNSDEIIVTEQMLKDRFSDDDLAKIRTGRHKYYMLIDYFQNEDASVKLF